MVAWSSPLPVAATSGAHRDTTLLLQLLSGPLSPGLGLCPPANPFGRCSTSSFLPAHSNPEQPPCSRHRFQCLSPWRDVQLRAWPSGAENSPGAGGGTRFKHLHPASSIAPGTSLLPRSTPGPHPAPHFPRTAWGPSSPRWLFLGAPWVQTPLCLSNPVALLGLCPPPAPQPRQAPAAPLCPPTQLCPITPTEGLGVASL